LPFTQQIKLTETVSVSVIVNSCPFLKRAIYDSSNPS
jgi:hypothetical protein